MTYAIRIDTKDGEVTASAAVGGTPDGSFTIRGHDDGNRIRLAVHQHDADGRFVTSAEHVLDRAEKALEDAEDTAEAVTEAGGEAAIGVAAAGESIVVVRE